MQNSTNVLTSLKAIPDFNFGAKIVKLYGAKITFFFFGGNSYINFGGKQSNSAEISFDQITLSL